MCFVKCIDHRRITFVRMSSEKRTQDTDNGSTQEEKKKLKIDTSNNFKDTQKIGKGSLSSFVKDLS